jgi:hypothetical protein
VLVVTLNSVYFVSGGSVGKRMEDKGDPVDIRWGTVHPTNGTVSSRQGKLLQLVVGRPLVIEYTDPTITDASNRRTWVTSPVDRIIS